MGYIVNMNEMTILEKYKLKYDKLDIDIEKFSYDTAKCNTHKKNIEIIKDYINCGDYIEIEFLQENCGNPTRIRQIAAILLERYLCSV